MYKQAPNGDDMVIQRKEQIVDIDYKTGQTHVVEVDIKDRVIDDELPDVANVYLNWLKNI